MKRLNWFVGVVVLCLSAQVFAGNSAVGYWKTIDDESGEAKSIVRISENKHHELSAKVVRLFKQPNKRCTACDGALHNRPIKGMRVMTGLIKDKDDHAKWSGGQILDPKSGKTYHCNISLADQGQKLNVRGYIGMPLFGRSQTWERVHKAELAAL